MVTLAGKCVGRVSIALQNREGAGVRTRVWRRLGSWVREPLNFQKWLPSDTARRAHENTRAEPSLVAEAPQHERLERIGGDFFAEIPVQADAYLLHWIIHDWSDDQCITILKNIRKSAQPAHGSFWSSG